MINVPGLSHFMLWSIRLTLCFLVVTACDRPAVSIKDYYYPLASIQKFKVYEYAVESPAFKAPVPEFLKLGSLGNHRYYLTRLDEKFNLLDSTIVGLSPGSIDLIQKFIPDNNRLLANSDSIQVLYPDLLNFGTKYRRVIHHHDLNSSSLQAIQMSKEVGLMHHDSNSITLKQVSHFVGEHKDGAKDTYLMVDEIINKKGVGMVFSSTLSSTGVETIRLMHVYSSDEWEQLLRKE